MDQLKLVALDEQDLNDHLGACSGRHDQGRRPEVHAAREALHPAHEPLCLGNADGPAPGQAAAAQQRAALRSRACRASRGHVRGKAADVLELLAIRFVPGEAPGGTIELVFSGGGAIRLDVECIEARLADLGGAWEASSRPQHRV